MTAQDHDLAQSVAADLPATTAPNSPPRRDPADDTHASPVRKRPRLDSGRETVRDMSADSTLPKSPTITAPEQKVEMTIRSHPPSSPMQGREEDVPHADTVHGATPTTPEASPVIIASTENESGSPPIMLIEDDDEPSIGFEVRHDAESHFRGFPFAGQMPYGYIVRELPNHLQQHSPFESDFLLHLTIWLEQLPEPSSDTRSFYAQKATFWDDFAAAVSKLLSRKVSYGVTPANEPRVEIEFSNFLRVYMRLCSHLFLSDTQEIIRFRGRESYSPTLLTLKHMRLLQNIMRVEKTPVLHLLNKEYDVEVSQLLEQLKKDFLKARGAQNLLRFLDESRHLLDPKVQDNYALCAAPVLNALGYNVHQIENADAGISRTSFNQGVLSFLEKYGSDLQDLSKVSDANVARDTMLHFAMLLGDLCQWDRQIAAELADKLLDFGDPDSPSRSSPIDQQFRDVSDYRQDPNCFPALCMNAWKFKVLRKYIVKGNMSLRVMSIATMDASLLDIWSRFHTAFPPGRHPVMQYLADFLLQGQVVDFIVSVDSHPQLISRSGNIVGCLVVTHRWSDRQADAIWNTVATSTDPRVVVATTAMTRSIVHLMETPSQLYLCQKLHDLPLDRYTLDILRFHAELIQRMDMSNVRNLSDEPGSICFPWDVCIRIIRETAPTHIVDRSLADLHIEASSQLQQLLLHMPAHARHTAIAESAKHIAARDTLGTGSSRVISMLMQMPHPEDGLFFQEHEDLVRDIVEELPAFVEAESQTKPYPHMQQALGYRLDLLKVMICKAVPNFPTDLYNDLWDHIIGHKALSNEARDLAWGQLITTIKMAPANDFCKQLISAYLPTIDPELFTPGLFEFVANYHYDIKCEKAAVDGDKPVLQIPGADLLWPIMLSAPVGTIEDHAAQLLAARYVKIVDNPRVSLADVEEAHVALVDRCMKELRAARETTEARVGRILLFQKLLLETVREKPEFNRARRMDSKVDADDIEVPFTHSITLKYQCGNERQTVTMDADSTMDDLYRRLCHTTGYSKINLFAKGKRLYVAETTNEKLAAIDFGGQIIVQRAEGAETTHTMPGPARGISVFETTISKNFDELYSWMQSDDDASRMLFEFLSSLPAPPRFADSVVNGTTDTKDLFPPGKMFQARYVANALRSRLREHIFNSTLNEDFISKSIQHLESALLDNTLIGDSVDETQPLQLGAVLVSVLLELLRGNMPSQCCNSEVTNPLPEVERPSAETSAGYFKNGPTLVARLMLLATVAKDTPSFEPVAHDAYATILEASLHSKKIWETFVTHPGFVSLHSSLLLTLPETAVREQTASKILSLCGELPSTSPITRAETTANFWAAIHAVIPEAASHHGQSQQLFDAAAEVFRKYDEHHQREEALRAYLGEWSALLLAHHHEEFVGRDQVDHFVLGLTKLLHCTILSLKSFKKPLHASSLMTRLFRKFLFIASTSSPSIVGETQCMPVLESTTRKKLFDLMLALAEDQASYNVLLRLMADIELDETDQTLSPNLVDRTAEVRSDTGYVGLYNPRAICYLNSLMTQLFMNTEFRKFIFSIELQDPRNAQQLLHATQKLFAEMQNSFRKSTDPRSFAALVKTLDKTPIDLSVQMDVDEFYNLLFDQWEAQLFKPEHKQKFRSFYGGQTLNQIKSKECTHVSERTEPFFAVQCDIQGKPNLQESLQAFVQGDVMEGDNKYKCESCGGKFVDAVKRTCLKDVPNNLIFHLKRFEFDLVSMSRHKIYDHFAFPESIDISQYKIDHLSDPSDPHEADVFDLVGVLVHTGTCENGHYYSYIRERTGQETSQPPSWIEFNDSDVSTFDPVEISDRAFGGFTEGDGYTRQTKQYSAYMLFYQRRMVDTPVDGREVTYTSTDPPKVAVPEHLEDAIAQDNKVFIREYCLFDPGHAKFVKQLHEASRKINHGTCSEDHDLENRALVIALTHFSRIAWRQHTVETSVELLSQLRRSVLSCVGCCTAALVWLGSDDSALKDIFFRSTYPKLRFQFRAFLLDSLKYLRDQDPVAYGADPNDSEMDIDSLAVGTPVLRPIIRRLRIAIEESGESVRGWEDFYLTMTQLVDMGPVETATILDDGFLWFCAKMFCLRQFPTFREQNPGIAHIMDRKRCVFNRLIGFLWKLLSQIDLSLDMVSQKARDRYLCMDADTCKFPISREEYHIIFTFTSDFKAYEVLDKVLEYFDDSKTEYFYPGEITKWMFGSASRDVPRKMLSTFREGYQLEAPFADAYVRASLAYCEACPDAEDIKQLITTMSEIVSTPKRHDERSLDAELVLVFFDGLLRAENRELFERTHPHMLHELLMECALGYAMYLLCYPDGIVRKATHVFLAQLYHNDEAIPPETVLMKYTSVRDLLPDIMVRIGYEKEAGTLRSHLTPLVETCRVFVHQLWNLVRDDTPESEQFKDVNDTALISQYQQEVEARLRMWPQDQGTPLSAGDGFDQSDYGKTRLISSPGSLLDTDGTSHNENPARRLRGNPIPIPKIGRIDVSTNF